jgi:hypothetical protein
LLQNLCVLFFALCWWAECNSQLWKTNVKIMGHRPYIGCRQQALGRLIDIAGHSLHMQPPNF